MRAATSFRPLGFGRAMRVVTAIAAIAQLLVVIAAPLAERASSDVAPVHVEQAGTRTHHAHGELCATCVALHLLAHPPRGPLARIEGPASSRPRSECRSCSTSDALGVLLPRAPPA